VKDIFTLTLEELRAFAIMIKYHSPNFISTNTDIMKDACISKEYIDSLLSECLGVSLLTT
jgi:hypothetical protein